ncbi:MAG TPA: site-2 protease family protein [Solirubrobacteraceae bacterium]|nr:site-2 protease family protein [Solirubrobacteraceae bacterium]
MGSGSIQLARLFGIRIGASPSWFLVLFLMIYWLSGYFGDALDGYSNTTAYATAVAGAVLFFVSLVLHELGHALVARRNGIRVTSIDLWFFGGLARLTREPASPGQEFRIAGAGPAVTFVLAIACWVAGVLAAGSEAFGDMVTLGRDTPTPALALLSWLVWINTVVLLFNLVPAFPLDGGRIVKALAWRLTGDPNRGTRFAARLGQGFAYLLMGGGVYLLLRDDPVSGLWFLLLGWFLAQAARGAVVTSRFSERLEGVTVADVMDTQPVTVPGELSVLDAHDEYFLRYRWPWFPVVDRMGRFVGILRQESVEGAVSDGRALTVGDVLDPSADADSSVGRDTPIEQLLDSQALRHFGALMVVDGEQRLCGVVTLEQVRRALASAVPGPV